MGKCSRIVTDVQHTEVTGYLMTTVKPSIIWDKAVFDVKVDSYSYGLIKVLVKITHTYDGLSVLGATTVVNG